MVDCHCVWSRDICVVVMGRGVVGSRRKGFLRKRMYHADEYEIGRGRGGDIKGKEE